MRRVVSAFPLLLALLLGPLAPGLSPVARPLDDAAPAGESIFPITADPADCQVEPRSADDLIALWFENGTPVADATTPVGASTITEVTVPVGTSADAETVVAVTDTMRGIVGCFAAGDIARGLALFTDDLARGFNAGNRLSEQDVRELVAAPPAAGAGGEFGQILAITNVMDLEDGRVGAFVVDRDDGPLAMVYAIFERGGDRLLVDEVIEFRGR